MKGSQRYFVTLLVISVLLSSCTPSGYWVPPSAPVTAIPDVVFSNSQPASTEPVPPAVASASPTLAATGQPAPVATLSTETAVQLATVTLAAENPTLAAITDTPPAPSEITQTPHGGSSSLAAPLPNPDVPSVENTPLLYYVQAADTLPVVAVRFGVNPSEITSPEPISENEFLDPGQLLVIPRRLANTTSSKRLIPDSEVVFSPSTTDFDAGAFVVQAGGKMSDHREWLKSTGQMTGAEVVMRVATENSINPRLLLALLEYQSQWVYGQPGNQEQIDFPLGKIDLAEKGLYNQLVWAVNQLSIGYYAYREGRLTEIHFSDGVTARLAPDLNAGTAALQYFFAQLHDGQQWLDALDAEKGFPALYTRMYGDPWERAQTVEPLYPKGITQPPLILPFVKGWTWAYTGGPHGAWEHDGAYAALDFAPGANESGCVKTDTYVLAAASGLVVRSGNGVVVLDLDGDGREQTGWVLVYLHLSNQDRISIGEWVDTGDPLGHPSCEGGISTGTHVHIARKFNGEWVPADGPLAFDLSGWIAHASGEAYKGTLTRNGVTITACTCSSSTSWITRTTEDP